MAKAPAASVDVVHRPTRGLACLVILAAFSQLGCESDASTQSKRVGPGRDVTLQAGGTAEALDSMLAVEAEPWDWSAGVVQTPTAGAELPSDVPFTFTWATELVHEDADAASEPALAGVAFLLQFSTPVQDPIARVFTTLNEYTPSDKEWSAFASLGEEITLHVNSADFSANQIAKNGGPFSGLGAKFTIVHGVTR